MSVSESRRPRDPVPAPPRTGRLVLGILLVLLGAGWFLETVGLVDLRWTIILPVVLLVIGGVLLATAHRGPADGLIGAGIFVSLLVIVTSLVTVPLGGQFTVAGDVHNRPDSVAALEEGYGLGFGSLEIDLRETPAPPEPLTVGMGVAVGQLTVLLPPDVTVEVRARTGIGEAVVDGRSRSGIGVSFVERIDGEQDEVLLVLELSVGLGQVEVYR